MRYHMHNNVRLPMDQDALDYWPLFSLRGPILMTVQRFAINSQSMTELFP